jgi:hypothetical protein
LVEQGRVEEANRLREQTRVEGANRLKGLGRKGKSAFRNDRTT